ncbi:MAG: pyridoxal phosphate-dependent aminotransferase [Clostridiales bacterium]|nr:pyridoxal phosphate-dependent aminotransferase [Clostridiales bacterium]
MKYNKQVMGIAPSKSVAMLPKVQKMQKTDPEIINMMAGEPDFDSSKPACEEVTQQLMAGYNHYTEAKGNQDLRDAIAKKLKDENNAPYSADHILITPGGKYAVYLAMQALLNPGDEVIWLTPGWVSYPSITQLCGGTPVAVHLKYDEDYAITYEALEAAASPNTKLLVINYPNNPTGKILSERDLEALTAFLRNHPDVFVLSDEVYEKIVYDDRKVVSIASYPEFFDRVIVVNSFSKAFAMTGWRVGYIACNAEIADIALKIFQHTISCTSGFLQKGALTALSCTDKTEEMRREFEHRRDIFLAGIQDIPGVELKAPEGAFYAWVRFDTKKSSARLAEELLEKAKIAGLPGNAYGEEEKCCIRFSFASEEEIRAMLRNLKRFVAEGGLE